MIAPFVDPASGGTTDSLTAMSTAIRLVKPTIIRLCGTKVDRQVLQIVVSGGHMAFILGVVFFVVVVGLIDARLPWPRSGRDPRA